MNDPHVGALLYRIEHSESIDWSAAQPLELDEARLSSFPVRSSPMDQKYSVAVSLGFRSSSLPCQSF